MDEEYLLRFGMKTDALLDTGSQSTIIPVRLLKKAIGAGINLGDYVERLLFAEVKMKDASGNQMSFLDLIRVLIILNGRKEQIPAYVRRSMDHTHCCDHVFRSLALHDGSLLSLPHDGGTGFPIDQLNDLNNEGAKFAKINSWTEVVAKAQRQHSTLLLLPDRFRQVNTAFKPQHNVGRKVYFEFHEVSRALETMSENTLIVVGPTLDVTPPKKQWCRFASGLAAAARNGTRVIVLAPPRGDAAYAQIRIELNQAVDLAKNSAVLMSLTSRA
uniref:Peptidase A2 domain-containing protein n=1 Tax=Haemonchus contortus TaxID=6289 RepID=A0A7I4XW15_HAECO